MLNPVPARPRKRRVRLVCVCVHCICAYKRPKPANKMIKKTLKQAGKHVYAMIDSLLVK